MKLRHAVRGVVQVGFGAPRSVHQTQGRHQCVRGPLPAVPEAISWRGPLAVDRHLDKAFYVASRFEDSNLK
jgi:hypothetical protein